MLLEIPRRRYPVAAGEDPLSQARVRRRLTAITAPAPACALSVPQGRLGGIVERKHRSEGQRVSFGGRLVGRLRAGRHRPGGRTRPRAASVRTYLVLLVSACVLPATIAATFGFVSAYRAVYAALVGEAQANSRAMARTVDGVILNAIATLDRMASSPPLSSGDIVRFEAMAREVQPYLPGTNLVLTDRDGRQLVNTALAQGTALPMHGNPGFQRTVLSTGHAAVSDLFIGGALRRPLVAIEVPVRREGAISATLAMGFLPERFARIIAEQKPEPGWVVSILDSTGTIVARTHAAERFVGHKGTPALLAAMASRPQGTVATQTLEGMPVVAVYTRSEVAHWTVAVGIPEAQLANRVARWLAWLVAFSVGMLFVVVLLALLVAARIAGAVRSLREPARALGRGEVVEPSTMAITEAQVVADALAQASELLRRRTRELGHATQAARQIQEQADAFAHAALHDPLTGLPNRARFMGALEERIETRVATGGTFAVLFVDLDDFKPVNDVHGHAVGDELLCAFASRLRAGCRGADLVARLAGDEFAVLVDEHAPGESRSTVTHLRSALSRPYRVRDLTLHVSASIGVATYPLDGQDAAGLLHAADTAMYLVKAAGKRRGGRASG